MNTVQRPWIRSHLPKKKQNQIFDHEWPKCKPFTIPEHSVDLFHAWILDNIIVFMTKILMDSGRRQAGYQEINFEGKSHDAKDSDVGACWVYSRAPWEGARRYWQCKFILAQSFWSFSLFLVGSKTERTAPWKTLDRGVCSHHGGQEGERTKEPGRGIITSGHSLVTALFWPVPIS